MSNNTLFSRRQFLKLSGTAGTTALIAACAPGAGEEAAAIPQTATQSIPELLDADMPGSPDHPRGWTTVLPDLPEGLPPAPGQEAAEAEQSSSESGSPPCARTGANRDFDYAAGGRTDQVRRRGFAGEQPLVAHDRKALWREAHGRLVLVRL